MSSIMVPGFSGRLRVRMKNPQRRVLPWRLGLAAAVGGLVCFIAVARWAPEASIWLGDDGATEVAARRHAASIGFEVGDASGLELSTGQDDQRLADPGLVRRLVPDPEDQRRLLREVPPIRLRIGFDATTAEGYEGRLVLELGGTGQLVNARFDAGPKDRVDGAEEDSEGSMGWADDIAAVFFGEEAPKGETEGNRVRWYQVAGGPALEVQGLADGDWQASLYPARPDHDEDELAVVALLVLAVFGLAMVVMFLWRLSRARLGFGHVKVIAALVVLYVLGSAGEMSSWTDMAIFVIFAVPSIGLLLAALWAVIEAELRDWRPQALESWDRLVYRQPLRATGRDLVAGVAWGALLAGLYASGGAVGSWFGGGYSRILGDPGPRLLEGVFLVIPIAFGVGLGGRLLGTRASAVLGGIAATCMWLVFLPMTPVPVRLAWGLLLGVLCVVILSRRGLLVLVIAAVTALTLPSVGLVAMTWPRWWLGSLVGLATTVGALVGGLRLWRTAPVMGSPEVKPAYLSKIERIARLETEVELLRNFQLALLPENRLVEFGGGEAAWQMRTADQVGGDFLDFVTDEDGRLWMTVADVAGHGIACSMFTAFAKAAIAEHAAAGVTPAQALTRIRRLFQRLRSRRSMVTMILGVWDPRDRTLTVASAGHPPLVVWDGEQNREIGPPSRPLGIDLPGEDRDEVIVCPPGTIVLGYTDGVVEAVSPFGEPFGFERWPSSLTARSGQSASAILDALLADLDHHCGDVPADDDVTAVVISLA